MSHVFSLPITPPSLLPSLYSPLHPSTPTQSSSQAISSSDPSQTNLASDKQLRDKSKERSDKERRRQEKRREKDARASEEAGQGELDPEGGEQSAGQEGEVRRDAWSFTLDSFVSEMKYVVSYMSW